MTGGGAAQVCVLVESRSIDRAFDYTVPTELDGAVVAGALVACPLGSRRVLGVVVSREPPQHSGRLVDLLGVVDVAPIPSDLLEVVLWIADYYRAPIASCLRLALPPGAEGALRARSDGGFDLRPPAAGRQRLVVRPGTETPRSARHEAVREHLGSGPMEAAELLRVAGTTMPTLRRMADAGVVVLSRERAAPSTAEADAPPRAQAPDLSEDQRRAVEEIARRAGGGGALLVHGVTGSGKTEVYLAAMERVATTGAASIMLVPEIALTPQSVQRVRARFGGRVAVVHSGMTAAERVASWRRIRAGEVDVVVGARSAVLAPLPRLGLVIVDEEHDSSYKQDSSPRYDARRVAIERARRTGAPAVYGSATPRVETWHALERVSLSARVDGTPLPRVEVIDMRTQRAGPLSRPLERALRGAGERGEKAIVLLNRRGFSLMALCRSCGWIARCPSCDVALVHHRDRELMSCHHCGFEAPLPGVCPSCRSADIARQGSGTEALEEAIADAVPRSRLVRLDAGTAARRGAVADLLASFARPGPAILLGTQMVAKGHDLPDVTLAAVVGADAGLQRPDFRAEERTFSLIVQLAGRAGRRGESARVLVQAWEPEEPVVQMAAAHDVVRFLDAEVARRRERGYPPFAHLVRAIVEGERSDEVTRLATAVAERVRREAPELRLMGPAPLHRLRGRTRRALLARSGHAREAAAAFERALAALAPSARGPRVVIDVDPQDL